MERDRISTERPAPCDFIFGSSMASDVKPPDADVKSRWQIRQDFWRRKLGRLRLGVEPLEEQLGRYRGVTWALTLVPAFLAMFFLTLFTVFGRPDIGLILDAVLLLPIVLGAWLDYALLARRAEAYLGELRAHQEEQQREAAKEDRNDTTPEPA
jgi:fatty acid desaturase